MQNGESLKITFNTKNYEVTDPDIGYPIRTAIQDAWIALTDDDTMGGPDRLSHFPLTATFGRSNKGWATFGPDVPKKVTRAFEAIKRAYEVENPDPTLVRSKKVIIAERRKLMKEWKARHPGDPGKIIGSARQLNYYLNKGGYAEDDPRAVTFRKALLR